MIPRIRPAIIVVSWVTLPNTAAEAAAAAGEAEGTGRPIGVEGIPALDLDQTAMKEGEVEEIETEIVTVKTAIEERAVEGTAAEGRTAEEKKTVATRNPGAKATTAEEGGDAWTVITFIVISLELLCLFIDSLSSL